MNSTSICIRFGLQIELAAGGERPLRGRDRCSGRKDFTVQPHRQGYRFRGSFAQGAGVEVTADKTLLGRAWSSFSVLFQPKSFRRRTVPLKLRTGQVLSNSEGHSVSGCSVS